MYEPFSEAAREDPYPIYAALRAECPAYRSPDRSFWALSRHGDVDSALRDWRTYSSAGGASRPGDLMDLDPPRHDAIRRLFAPGFSRPALARVEDAVHASAEELVNGWRRTNAIDLARCYAQRLPALTICRVLGLPETDIAAAADDVVRMIWPAWANDSTTARMAARSSLAERFLTRVSGRIDTGYSPGLIGDIARAVGDGQIALDEVPGLCLMFTVAGAEPTASLLSSLIHALATSRIGTEQLLDESGSVRAAAIDEFLRYDPPVQWVSRVTTRSVTVNSQAIPAGARVLLLIGSANRDPHAYDRPDEFDPDRHRTRGLAFGAGVHACLGAALARLQTRIAVEVMLERLPAPRLAGPAIRAPSHVLRGFQQLPIGYG
jgi:cytochrome P450